MLLHCLRKSHFPESFKLTPSAAPSCLVPPLEPLPSPDLPPLTKGGCFQPLPSGMACIHSNWWAPWILVAKYFDYHPCPDPRHILEAMSKVGFTSEPQRTLGTDELFRLKAKVEDSSQTTVLLLVAACHMSSNLGGASCVLDLILKTLKSGYFTHFESE